MSVLHDLVKFNRDLESIKNDLKKFDWDIEAPIYTISVQDIRHIIDKALQSEISIEELENWANAIECREDIDLESEELREIVFELANPSLFEIVTPTLLKKILETLNT